MKKFISLLVMVALMATMILTGCGQNNAVTNDSTATNDTEATEPAATTEPVEVEFWHG